MEHQEVGICCYQTLKRVLRNKGSLEQFYQVVQTFRNKINEMSAERKEIAKRKTMLKTVLSIWQVEKKKRYLMKDTNDFFYKLKLSFFFLKQ